MKKMLFVPVLCFCGMWGHGRVLDSGVLQGLIDSSGDIVLTGGYDPCEGQTLMYAIPKARYDALPSSSHERTLTNIKLSPAAAVDAARKELVAKYPEAKDKNIDVAAVSLIPWEISRPHGHVWIYLVDFKAGEWFNQNTRRNPIKDGDAYLRFFVLLDGDSLPPRVTAYSRYLDENSPERKVNATSMAWFKKWWWVGWIVGILFLCTKVFCVLRNRVGK